MKKTVSLLFVLALVVMPVLAGEEKAADKRAKIDAMAANTLEELFTKSEKAESLFAESYGYAVFNNIKVSVGISGGGGKGVAVEKGTDNRTYMNVGTGGVNLGLGGQAYRVVFLFQDKGTYDKFATAGWHADASASASAANKGVNAATTFTNGMAVFQLTEAGLMLQADITGTKYWKADKLNN